MRGDVPARLVWVTKSDPPLDLDPSRAPLTLGRDPDNDLVVTDSHASRLHALFESGGTYWVVTDASRYGTELTSGDRAPELLKGQSRRLRHGDVLLFGATAMRFHQPRDGPDLEVTPPLQPKIDVTVRQMDVLMELAKPLIEGRGAAPASNGEIMEALYISLNTLSGHLAELYRRFDIDPDSGTPQQRRAELAAQWWRAQVR